MAAQISTPQTNNIIGKILAKNGFTGEFTCEKNDFSKYGSIRLKVKVRDTEYKGFNSTFGELLVSAHVNGNLEPTISGSLSKSSFSESNLISFSSKLTRFNQLVIDLTSEEVKGAFRSDSVAAVEEINQSKNKKIAQLSKSHRQLTAEEAKELVGVTMANRILELRGDTNRKALVAAQQKFTALFINEDGSIKNLDIISEHQNRWKLSTSFSIISKNDLIDKLTGAWVEKEITFKETQAKLR